MKEQLKRKIEYCAVNNCDDSLRLLLNRVLTDEFIHNQETLRLAIQSNSVDVVDVLLSYGADAKDDDSQLLCQSVADDKYEITELLIKYGADTSTDNDDPLRIALNMRNYRMALLLVRNGANIEAALELESALKYGAV